MLCAPYPTLWSTQVFPIQLRQENNISPSTEMEMKSVGVTMKDKV
jgi:hypothetical protein